MADQILQFIITAQNNAKQAFREAESQLSGLQNVAKKMSSGWQDTVNASKEVAIGLTVAGTAAGAFGMSAIKAAASIETQKIGFKNLLGSMEAADEAIKMIQKDAASTPFEFAGLVEANKALTMVTGDAKKSEQALMDVGKALAAAGKGQAELDRIIINLQQIGNVGKVSEMDIRQFGFAGVNILQLLADYYGTTKEAAGEMLKDSKDAFGDLTAAFYKAGNEGGKFADAFANAGGSANQMASNLSDSWNIFLSGEGEKLLVWYKKTLELMSDFIQNKLPEIIKKIEDLTKWFSENKTAIAILAGVITALLVPSFISAAAAIVAMAAALAPFAIAGGALAAFIVGIKEGNIALTAISGAIIAAFIPAIISATTALWAMIVPMIPALGALVVAFAPFLFGGAVIGGLVAGVVWLVQNWGTAKEYLTQTWEGLKIIASETFGPLVENTKNLFQGLWDGLTEIWNGIVEMIKGAINSIIGGMNQMIDAINSIKIKVPEVEYFPGKFFGGWEVGFPEIPNIPYLAAGGIVTSPTLAMIGEAGPEAVVPLSSAFGGGMGGYGTFAPVINIMGGYYLDRDAADEIGEKIIQKLKQTMKIG